MMHPAYINHIFTFRNDFNSMICHRIAAFDLSPCIHSTKSIILNSRGIILVHLQKKIVMKTTYTLGLAIALFLSSCSVYLSPYTSQVQQETQLNEEQLKKVQFYLSGDIILYRAFGNSETQITGGELKVVNGQQVEEIVIASGTPGVVIGVTPDNNLMVSFEVDGSWLLFGANSDYAGKYTLMAKKWEGRTGVVDYAGKEFKATPESIYAFLEVNLKEINSRTVQSKQAGGRTVE